MDFDLERRTARLGVGEFSTFAIGPRDAGDGPSGRWRAQLGTHWHQQLRAQTGASDPGAEFEVAIEGSLTHRGWALAFNGRIDQLVRNSEGLALREIKTVTRPLPDDEAVLRAEYPDYFVQLAAYAVLFRLKGAGAPSSERLNPELVFVEAGSGLAQTVALAPVDETRFFSQLDRLAEFLDLRLRARERLRSLRFHPPFATLRPGQETIRAQLQSAIAGCHSAILLDAPTGFGKTGVLLECALHQLRSGHFHRVLYVTGKSTGQIQVVQTLTTMTSESVRGSPGEGGPPKALAVWQVRAKSEHCVNHTFHCVRAGCSYLDDLEARWPQSGLSRFYLFENQARDLETLRGAGRSAGICPYEITRAALAFNDVWIGDYNYVFAPANRSLFWQQPGFEPERTLLVVDEAHNLPSRVADAYSHDFAAAEAAEVREAFDRARPPAPFIQAWDEWTDFLRQLEPTAKLDDAAEDEARDRLERLGGMITSLPFDAAALGPRVTELLWRIPALGNSGDGADLPRLWWCPRSGELAVTCLDAAAAIGATLREFGGVVLATATPGPADAFAETIGADTPLLHLPAEAPWRAGAYEVACDLRVDTRFRQREQHHATTAATVVALRDSASGSTAPCVVVFFPSYAYAEAIVRELAQNTPGFRARLQPRLAGLSAQAAWIEESLAGADALFLVLGSSFAESIDLLGGRVTHAMVVGPALPEVNAVQRARLAAFSGGGQEAAFRRVYQIPGMQKVNQALGRLVRAPGQRAKVLLHCRRFAEPGYIDLLAADLRPETRLLDDSDLTAWLDGRKVTFRSRDVLPGWIRDAEPFTVPLWIWLVFLKAWNMPEGTPNSGTAGILRRPAMLNTFKHRLVSALALAALALAMAPGRARAAGTAMVAFPNSIKEVAATAAPAGHPGRPFVSRRTLAGTEHRAEMTFEIALRMRNFSELQSRITQGQVISAAEMKAKYLPLEEDYARVQQWVRDQGFTVTKPDPTRLAVFARGPVDSVAQVLHVTFARVTSRGAEYTSAVTPPSLPAAIAPLVAGIQGLQPHVRPHRHFRGQTGNTVNSSAPPYVPSQVAGAYNANGLGLTGSGQTIALFELAYPATNDLRTFWSTANLNPNTLQANYQTINVGSGPVNPSTDALEESTLDVEWSSSLAPGAVIRTYGASEDDNAFYDEIYQKVIADLPSQPTLHILSISFGFNEEQLDEDYLLIEAQYMAVLASSGVTVLAASGDSGSNPDLYNNYYNASAPVEISYPAGDPSVTGVGGTTLKLNTDNTVATETAWSLTINSHYPNGTGSDATGGGISGVFNRPAWQVGAGVPAGAMRLMPDVAAVGDPATGGFFYCTINGSLVQPESIGGTSLSTPIWAAFCALIDQSRANASQGPLGLLNPSLYPLLGSSCFRDVISGSNGAYTAGVGYDMCTGLGVPNVSALVQASLSGNGSPVVLDQLGGQIVTLGQTATFGVAAYGTPLLSYQWQSFAPGASAWANLSDNPTYGGSATSILTVSGATSAMSGTQFQCVVTNTAGSAISSPSDALTVNPYGVTTLAGWPGAPGSTDATGRAASFNNPGGVRLDSSGNAYVSDAGNNTIRKVTPGGVVTTLAGSAGVAGSANGTGSAALFDGPGGVAVDSSGNVYVADSGNYMIRKITPGGVVTTLAGQAGHQGATDGTGSGARFYDPQNLAIDSAGNLWVADGAGDTIRLVTPAGVVTTIAGAPLASALTNGPGANARFNDPTAVAVDSAGNIYVADNGNNAIRKITPAYVVTTLAGNGHAGTADGANAEFGALVDGVNFGPAGIAVDASGNVYVADSGNNTIREISPTGVVATIAGSPTATADNIDGLAGNARFNLPSDIALDSANNLYVADYLNDTIRRIVPSPLVAPAIQSQPASAAVSVGGNVTLSVTAGEATPLTYQWLFNSAPISGATKSTLTLSNVSTSQGGAYSVIVTNNAGSVTSSVATLTVGYAPVFTLNPQAVTIAQGRSAAFSVTATGTPAPTYQWYLGSTPISGATDPILLVQAAASTNAGTYTCVATNSITSVTSSAATLTVDTAGTAGYLLNISTRGNVGLLSGDVGPGILFAGVGLSGSGNKTLLIRGGGPGLAYQFPTLFTSSDVVSTPRVALISADGTVLLDQNTVWGTTTTLKNAFILTGAFAFQDGSADSALLDTVPVANYNVEVTTSNGSTVPGIGLVEVYDADTGTPTAHIVNLSARDYVGVGGHILIGGFVIGGTDYETLLVRSVGPGLYDKFPTSFTSTNVLAQPVVTIVQGSTAIYSNTGWGGDATLASAMATVGAYALNPAHQDSALLVSLPPGNYTIIVSGVGGGTGQATVEFYDMP